MSHPPYPWRTAIPALLLALAACGEPVDDAPIWPDADWATVDPVDAGLDPAALGEARSWVMSSARSTQAVLVVKDGRLVAEWYDDEHGPADPATSWSMTKSLTGTLVGIALDRGELADLDAPIGPWFPSWGGDARGDVTLRQLVQMRSGLAWGAWPDQELGLFLQTPDQLAAATDREAAHPPGSTWAYSSGDAMLVSGILEQATGSAVGDYAEAHLFGPLGITATWWTDAAGHALTYCCVDATPRDLARFGLMAARRGAWGDGRVVSEGWLDAATAPQDDVPWYGMLWWTYLSDVTVDGAQVASFVADGLGNQRIYAFPSLDLVIVRTTRYARTGDGHVRTGTTMPITPGVETWSDGDFLRPLLRALDPDAVVGPICRDDPEGACGLGAP